MADKPPEQGKPGEAPKPAGIDPFPILGDILNYFERLIISHAAVTENLVQLVRDNNIEAPKLEESYERLVNTYNEYMAFKRTLTGKPEPGDGQ